MGTIKITKYENRKLYSTTHRKFVTTTELAKLIASGKDVEVRTQNGGEDITEKTLMSVINKLKIPKEDLFSIITQYTKEEV